MIARIITTFVGIIFIIYGAIAAVSPLPLGVVLIAVGLIMIAGANPAARPLIRRMRKKWRWFDKLVRLAARRSPEQFKEVIEETDPEADKDDGEESDENADAEKTATPPN